MQRMTDEVAEAALSGDWATAVTIYGKIADEVQDTFRDLVNLARTVGGMSDAEVARLRGVSASAVTQRFGARSRLLQERMAADWEAAIAEWRAKPDA